MSGPLPLGDRKEQRVGHVEGRVLLGFRLGRIEQIGLIAYEPIHLRPVTEEMIKRMVLQHEHDVMLDDAVGHGWSPDKAPRGNSSYRCLLDQSTPRTSAPVTR